MKIYSAILAAGLTLTTINSTIAAPSKLTEDEEIKGLIQFLISDKLLVPGKYSQLVPLSYYIGKSNDIAGYFGDYICAVDDTCRVVDSLYSNPFAILGKGLPPQNGTPQEVRQAQAQIERTDMKYGVNIYDAATWQIALGLAAKNGYLSQEKAKQLIANQSKNIANTDNRATAKEFKYGYQKPIADPKKAFAFRMVATDFFNRDPFYDSKYKDLITWDFDPEQMSKDDPAKHPADFFTYSSTWSDWKPITGENAWAQLIGPLQAEYLANNGKVSTATLENAINSLEAFSAMQAGIGAFYYAPGGSLGNQGEIPRGEISLENNFSVLGGLQILQHILHEMPATAQTKNALSHIDVMLNGGTTINGYQTLGLLSFLYNGAYHAEKGTFYTHGTASDPSSQNDWQPDTSLEGGANAVDVNTWGISALGPETIDAWYGKGTALKIWQNVREQGGYFAQGKLWGVGYTLNNSAEKIMSTEWSAGAINTVNALIAYYAKQKMDVTALQKDLSLMQEGIKNLRNDRYLNANFDGATPKQYFLKLTQADGYAYLYASKRFAIPFGWNANTLPSTTSNAWVLMNHFNFNPFQYQGKLSGENYKAPAKVDIINNNPPVSDVLPKEVEVNFNSGDLNQNGLGKIAISYRLDGDNNWNTAATADKETGFQGKAKLPKGTKIISIAFLTSNWYGACQLSPATKICKDNSCDQLQTIVTKWSADGQGPCGVE